MNSGKVSNSILKRSVLKLIKKVNKDILQGPAIGVDCAQIAGKDGCNIVTAVSSADYAVFRVCNNIAVAGGRCTAITCSVIMPRDFEEAQLKSIMKNVQEQCDILQVGIAGGNTMVSDAVVKPVVNINGIGMVENGKYCSMKNVKPNQDIIVTKWIGIEGANMLADLKQEDILKRYRMDLISAARGNIDDMSIQREAEIAASVGISAMSDVSEGGIFASLWNMSEAGNVGFEVDFKKISVKQEIIEVCEIFDVSPYAMMSSGCLLMTSERGCDIVKILNNNGIEAVIIGKTTAGNDKIIKNDDEIRYLDPPQRDEIYKI